MDGGSGRAVASAASRDFPPPAPAPPPPVPPAPARAAACDAPSLHANATADAFETADLARCAFEPTRQEHLAKRCGKPGARVPLDLERLDRAVLDLDPATRAHVERIVRRGRAAGRNPRAVGLAGDSLTVAPSFFGPFGKNAKTPAVLAPEVERRLSTGGGRTIVDRYRGEPVVVQDGLARDSFEASRAARVGARVTWLVEHDDVPLASPIDRLVATQSPAVVVVLAGTNDAAYGTMPLDELAARFRADLGRVIDALEERGVVPVLTTLPRHGRQPGIELCGEISNWALVVRTNAVHRAVIDVACERALPIVDLRYALDPLPNHGLGPDGVHLSAHEAGGGKLDEEGLSCGFNVRNYVTLRALAKLWPVVVGE